MFDPICMQTYIYARVHIRTGAIISAEVVYAYVRVHIFSLALVSVATSRQLPSLSGLAVHVHISVILW